MLWLKIDVFISGLAAQRIKAGKNLVYENYIGQETR